MNNSNNRPLGWTTFEESKQLVEAGLPVRTSEFDITGIQVIIKQAMEDKQ